MNDINDVPTEEAMILAHKAGCAFAQDPQASLGYAKDKAEEGYITRNEREAFVAGYLGTIKRMNGNPAENNGV